MTEGLRQWTVTRSFELAEPVARSLAYDLAGQAFEMVSLCASIDRITLEPRRDMQKHIWFTGSLYEEGRREVERCGRLARIKVDGRSTHDTVHEIKEIADDYERRILGILPAAALVNEWLPGIVALAEALLAKGEMDGHEVHAIIDPYILGKAA
jgi:hypothetical protein